MLKMIVIFIIACNGVGILYGAYLLGKSKSLFTPSAYAWTLITSLITIYLLVRAYL